MAIGIMNALARLAIGAMCLGAFLPSALASDYPDLDGQTIRVIIGSTAGETTDTLSRAYFKVLERELPQTTIRIQNISGGNKAWKELAGASPTTITLVVGNRGAIYRQLLKPDAELDLTQVDWVGSLAQSNRMLAVRRDFKATTAEAILKMEGQAKMGALAFDASAFEPLLVSALTEFRFKLIEGMTEGERHSMILNGELDGRTGGRYELQALFDNGEMVAFLKLKKDGYPPAFDSIPALADYAAPGSDPVVLSTVESLDRLGGLLIASAKMTDNSRLELLRRAVAKAAQSPDFVTEAERNGAAIKFTDGVALAQGLQPIVDPAKGVGEKMRAAIECGRKKSETGLARCN
jgi:hypothetical protein